MGLGKTYINTTKEILQYKLTKFPLLLMESSFIWRNPTLLKKYLFGHVSGQLYTTVTKVQKKILQTTIL